MQTLAVRCACRVHDRVRRSYRCDGAVERQHSQYAVVLVRDDVSVQLRHKCDAVGGGEQGAARVAIDEATGVGASKGRDVVSCMQSDM
jgi:hypothetical protein